MATAPPRRQPPDVRREQLLDAAEQVLVQRGLRATTVADVAEAAGVAKGTMYLYYESKDDLLAGLRSRYLEQYAEALRPSPDKSVSDRIRQMIVGLFDFAGGHHDLHHLLFHEAGFSEDDAFASVRDGLTALIAEGVETGELRAQDVPTAAAFVLHGVHGALVDWLHGSSRTARRRVANEVADLVDRALR
jgi:AcrR family transcriptional regulator